MQRLRSPFRLRPNAGSEQRKGKPKGGPDLGRGHGLDDGASPDLRRADDAHDAHDGDLASERSQETQPGQPAADGSEHKR